MCSIIGYSGKNSAAPILVKGLQKMEYRGYDSVGIATESENKIVVKKGVGRVVEVSNAIQLDKLPGNIGIGHTRWATHGKVTEKNAHPHSSNSGKIAIVHNGIVENFEELKSDLQNKGYEFQSETDTEVIANLIQLNLDETSDVKQSIIKTVNQIKGHYSFVAIFDDGTLAAARFHEPLIVGVGKNGNYLSSDVLGFIENTDDAIYVDNEDFVIVNDSGIHIFDFDGTLADCKKLHQDAFREAMQQLCPGSEYKDTDIEGRPTTEKIKIMHTMGYQFNGDKLNEIKQSITQENLDKYVIYNDPLHSELQRLSKKYKLCLASNATNLFVHKSLKILKIEDFFLRINTATDYPAKPDVTTFMSCMRSTGSSPATTLIFEDSEVGIQGAKSVTSNVIEVIDVEDTINEMRKL